MALELVNKLSDQVIYSYDIDADRVEIKDKILEANMKNAGVRIPSEEQQNPDSLFCGITAIKLGEKNFHVAFYQFYWSHCNTNEFGWRTSDS